MIVHVIRAVSLVTQDGSTPLTVASHDGCTDVVKTLVKYGADVNLLYKVYMYIYVLLSLK